MTFTIAVVIVVLLLMSLIIFFLLKKEIKDINDSSRVYFTHKVQEYTEHIDRSDNDNEVSVIEEEKNENKDNEVESSSPSIVYLEKKANYEIDDLLKMMKEIDSKFTLDNTKLIKLFIKKFVTIDEDQIEKYNSLKRMKDFIEKIGILKIITSDDETLIDSIISKLRLINEDVFNEYYSVQDEFQIDDFCNYLDYEMGKCDPTIYVYVGDEGVNYNWIDKHIKTIYSKDIYKGLKIKYLNQLYDFSLS